jgi:hypothetical protein
VKRRARRRVRIALAGAVLASLWLGWRQAPAASREFHQPVPAPSDANVPIVVGNLSGRETEATLEVLTREAESYWDLDANARTFYDALIEQRRLRLGLPAPEQRMAPPPDVVAARAATLAAERAVP